MRFSWLYPAFLLIGILMLQTSCKTSSIKAPEERYEQPVEDRLSILNLPIRIPVQELERSLNTQLEGVLYRDSTFDDGDNMMVEASKSEHIELTIDSQLVKYKVPLSLWIKYDIGFTTVEAKGDLSLAFATSFEIKEDWSLETKTELQEYQWLKEPKVKLVGVSIPVGFIAGILLDYSKNTLAESIDEQVKENLKLNEMIADAWRQMYDPILASPEYNAWILVKPQSIGMTPLDFGADTIASTIVVVAKPKMYIGEKPEAGIPSKLPPFQYVYQLSEDFTINLNAEIAYAEAERLVKDQLIGETYSSGSRSVTVEDIEFYGKDEKLVVNTKLSGSYEGNVYMEGVPYYYKKKNSIDIKDLDYALDTKNFLYRSAGWLLKSRLKKEIQNNLDFLLEYNLEEIKNQMKEQLKNYPLTNEIFLNGDLNDLSIEDAYLTKKALGVYIGVNGQLNIQINGLN